MRERDFELAQWRVLGSDESLAAPLVLEWDAAKAVSSAEATTWVAVVVAELVVANNIASASTKARMKTGPHSTSRPFDKSQVGTPADPPQRRTLRQHSMIRRCLDRYYPSTPNVQKSAVSRLYFAVYGCVVPFYCREHNQC